MNLVLKSYKLPDELVFLLKSNLTHDKNIFNYIFEVLKDNQALHQLFNFTFSLLDKEKNFLEMMRSLGWLHFRDRLSALYLNQIKDGYYSPLVDSSIINDLLVLEQKLENHTIQSVSRSYLLGFYLSVMNLSDGGPSIKIPQVIFDILKVSQIRIDRIDWMVLTLWHFSEFIGEKKLHELIVNERKMYQNIYALLSHEQKKQMHRNLLHYSYSINDPDFFKDQMI